MDKSLKYVQMCAAANEIQQLWKQQYGDFYATESGNIKCWIAKKPAAHRVRHGFNIDVQDDVIYLSKYVWLPRQSQLIEMAQLPGRRYESIVQDFFNWTQLPYQISKEIPGKLFPSMEQIWLAFLMQQKYFKQWNGNAWLPSIRRPAETP